VFLSTFTSYYIHKTCLQTLSYFSFKSLLQVLLKSYCDMPCISVAGYFGTAFKSSGTTNVSLLLQQQ